MKLMHIFFARLWSTDLDPQDMATLTYKKLIEVAKQADVDVEMCLA